MRKTTFANIASQLESAFAIAVRVGTNTSQLAMYSLIEDVNTTEITSFELITSDGSDGYETLHQFDIKSNQNVLLLNDGKEALMQDDDGNFVTINMLKSELFTD